MGKVVQIPCPISTLDKVICILLSVPICRKVFIVLMAGDEVPGRKCLATTAAVTETNKPPPASAPVLIKSLRSICCLLKDNRQNKHLKQSRGSTIDKLHKQIHQMQLVFDKLFGK